MGMTVMTSRVFNQQVSKAKRDAKNGPVFITDRGRPAHVLLSIDDYHKIADKGTSIVEWLAMPELTAVEFEPPRLADKLVRLPDLS